MKDYRTTLNEVTSDTTIEGRWADRMYDLTPVEQKSNNLFVKRDDFFAPLGINSINGSKCRQLLWLFDRETDVDTVVHATNLNSSPQTPMVAAMAEHYGYRNIQVGGGTTFKSINKKDLPLAATLHGAEYDITVGSGFNVVIQKRVDEIMLDHPNSFKIERDITLDHKLTQNTPAVLREFHSVGAAQVANIPDTIENLLITFGSSTSTTSVMLGLADAVVAGTAPKALKTIHLINVGVDKRSHMFDRLELMGADVSMYDFVWMDTEVPYAKTFKDIRLDDITFHYRYEAKAYKYLLDNRPDLINEKSLFWIIGSVPSTQVTAFNTNRKVPTEVTLYEA